MNHSTEINSSLSLAYLDRFRDPQDHDLLPDSRKPCIARSFCPWCCADNHHRILHLPGRSSHKLPRRNDNS